MAREVPALKWAERVGWITLYKFSGSLCLRMALVSLCHLLAVSPWEHIIIWIISTSCTGLLSP